MVGLAEDQYAEEREARVLLGHEVGVARRGGESVGSDGLAAVMEGAPADHGDRSDYSPSAEEG
ncbi:MAG: hypothetical protein DRJ42_06995 [Deltaproteobacteria bacterium]|nr:MAG: hypothetical protein DRJ42_06995 [Deltaproteobacteria bacterium]